METKTNPSLNLKKSEIKDMMGGFINPRLVALTWGINMGDKVADLGCGGGYFTVPVAHLVGKNGKVFAVDVMEGPIEAVKSKIATERLENVKVIRSDLEQKDSLVSHIEEGECQWALLVNVLYSSVKIPAILKEAKRILGKNGKLIIIDWEKKPKKAFLNFGPPIENRIGSVEAKNMAKKAGFKFQKSFEVGKFHFGLMFTKSN